MCLYTLMIFWWSAATGPSTGTTYTSFSDVCDSMTCLALYPAKCQFGIGHIDFLEHKVDAHVALPLLEKVATISNFAQPVIQADLARHLQHLCDAVVSLMTTPTSHHGSSPNSVPLGLMQSMYVFIQRAGARARAESSQQKFEDDVVLPESYTCW